MSKVTRLVSEPDRSRGIPSPRAVPTYHGPTETNPTGVALARTRPSRDGLDCSILRMIARPATLDRLAYPSRLPSFSAYPTWPGRRENKLSTG